VTSEELPYVSVWPTGALQKSVGSFIQSSTGIPASSVLFCSFNL